MKKLILQNVFIYYYLYIMFMKCLFWMALGKGSVPKGKNCSPESKFSLCEIDIYWFKHILFLISDQARWHFTNMNKSQGLLSSSPRHVLAGASLEMLPPCQACPFHLKLLSSEWILTEFNRMRCVVSKNSNKSQILNMIFIISKSSDKPQIHKMRSTVS